MRIERLKYWHWCVIGVIVGAMVASIKLYGGVKETPHDLHVRPSVFEEQVLKGRDPVGRRRIVEINKIVVHPADEIPVPGERPVETEFFSYSLWVQQKADPKKMEEIPHKVVMQLQQGAADKSVLGDVTKMPPREYLDKLLELRKKAFPKEPPLMYRYAWMETPRGAYSVYCIGGFVVIGLIWPTLVNLLARAGFGRPPEECEYDISRFGKGKPEVGKLKRGVTQADLDELARLDAELEAKLREGATARVVTAPAAAKAEPVMKKLTTEKLEPAKSSEALTKPKGFGSDQGDYYPTEVHGKNKE